MNGSWIAPPARALWPARATLGEGLCWSPRLQRLWWVDILGQRLLCCRADGSEGREWHLPETVSAVAECSDDPRLLLALRHRVVLFDPATGALETLAEVEADVPGNRFNDGGCDAAGRLWVGTMDFDCIAPSGMLYRIGPDGRAERAFAAGWPVTNGPAFAADGGTMFFNHTVGGRVMALPFDATGGRVGEPREWIRFAPGDGLPDGMTVDALGRLWVAHWGGGCVSCHAPDDGRELGRIGLPTAHVTNVAFGGPGLRTLFVTTARFGLDEAQLQAQPLAGALFALEPGCSGLPAACFAR